MSTEHSPILQNVQSQGRIRMEVGVIVQEELSIAGITEDSFTALKEKAESLAQLDVSGEDDLRIIQKVITEGTRMCSTISTAIAPGKQWAYKLHKAYTSNENEFIGNVKAIIEPLKEKKNRYLAEQERIKREEEAEAQRQLQIRYAALEDIGCVRRAATYDAPERYVIGDTVIPLDTINTADADVWDNLVRSASVVAAELQAKRKQEEEERTKMLEAQAELDRRQKELEEREAKMQQAVNEARRNELLAIGCSEWLHTKNGNIYNDFIVGVDMSNFGLQVSRLHTFSDTEWADEILAAKAAVEERNLAQKQAQEKAAREALIADRVKRLKEAGWEDDNGESIDAICLHTPSAIDSIAISDIPTMTDGDVVYWMSKGTEELTRREAARQDQLRIKAEAAARKRLEEEAAMIAAMEQERLSAMDDQEKWQEFARQVASAAPRMSSTQYKERVLQVIALVDSFEAQ